MTGKIAASGNINTLLKADGSVLDLTGRAFCFYYMFLSCTLTHTPKLPATTLAEACYDGMFYGCNSLSQAPELPAETLALGCYSHMFVGCKSLAQAPELPSTELADSCYYIMFSDCQSPFTFPDKSSDEIYELIQYYSLIGPDWYDENSEIINPIEIICTDTTLLAEYNYSDYTWTITEK